MTWKIEYLESVRKSVKNLDVQTRKRIRHYLEDRVAALDDPRQLGKPLKGKLSGIWRYRIGDFRVLAKLQNEKLIVLVLDIAHRKDVYR